MNAFTRFKNPYRRKFSSMVALSMVIIILLSVANCELVHKHRQFRIPFKSYLAEDRNTRASSNPSATNKDTNIYFQKNENKRSFKNPSDTKTSHLVRFPTSSQTTSNNDNLVVTERSAKEHSVKIVQNYSNVFNATHPSVDSSKLEANNLIEYLNYLHQLPPEDAAVAQQPGIIQSKKKVNENETNNGGNHIFHFKKETSTESPIETLNKLREKVLLSTTLMPSGINFPERSTDASLVNEETLEHNTESPIETLNKLREKLSPLLTTKPPSFTKLNNIPSKDVLEVATLPILPDNTHLENGSYTDFSRNVSFMNEDSSNYLSKNKSSSNPSEKVHHKELVVEDNTRTSSFEPGLDSDSNNISTTEIPMHITLQSMLNNQSNMLPEEITTVKLLTLNNVSIPSHYNSPDTKSLDTRTSIGSMDIHNADDIKGMKITKEIDKYSIPLSKITSPSINEDGYNAYNNKSGSIANIDPPLISGSNEDSTTTNTANVVHNFESIEVGVVVGVAIGVFIVLICFGSVMLCFRCGKQKDKRRGKESTLVSANGDCGNVGCSGNTSGGFFFGGRRNVYATMEHTNGESGIGENQLGYTSIYPTSGYFRQPGPPIILPHELIMNYDDGTSDNIAPLSETHHNSIELSCNYTKPIDLNKRSKSDKVTEL